MFDRRVRCPSSRRDHGWIMPYSRFLTLLACLTGFLLTLRGQPSGGPYGPQPRTYVVPAEAPHIYYVAPDGQVDAPGTTLQAPTTIESAIARVVTGDAI